MKYVFVTFPTNKNKEYCYQTELNLEVGKKYDILADGVTSYSTPVLVSRYGESNYPNPREITHAKEYNEEEK